MNLRDWVLRRHMQLRTHYVAPWGPHCYLKQGRHERPFSKQDKGRQRREERRFKLRQRDIMMELMP